MAIVVERVEQPTDEVRALIEALDAELSEGFEPHQRHGFNIAQIFQSHVRFFVARLDDEAVGCGAFAGEDGFAELKRMYVRPEVRGQGVVQALLATLEAEAAAAGYSILMLETGDTLAAARRVYEREGFRRRAAFGAYLQKPPHTIVRSIFMEKRIG